MSTEGKKFERKQFAFNGAWNPTDDPLIIGEENYSNLENCRYNRRRGGLEAVQGYTKININPFVVDWVLRASAADNNWRSICYAPELGLFCAVADYGAANRVMTSPDGVIWTLRTPSEPNEWTSVCWNPDLAIFCAVASSGTNRVMTSVDGSTWLPYAAAALNEWQSVCWSSDLTLFVAVSQTGTDNRVMTSPNGTAWTIRTPAADNSWWEVCYSPELTLFVAVSWNGGTQQVMTSPNGTAWTIRTTNLSREWYGICWCPELTLFVIVGSGLGQLLTSPDGFNWTPRTCPTNMFQGVCWCPGPNLFIATAQSGTDDRIITSPDGINWLSAQSIENNSWNAVCWSPELLTVCSVSSTGTGNRVITAYLPETFNKARSGIQLVSPHTQKSRVIVQAFNADEDASGVVENLTDIPDQGNFEGAALHLDAAGAGLGRFSKWPGGHIAYCNSKEAKVYSGDEKECDTYISSTGVIDDEVDDPIDYTDSVKNILDTPGNIAIIGGGVDTDTKLLLHCDGIDESTTFDDDGDTGHVPVAVAGAEIDTDYQKYGNASGKMIDVGDYIYVPDHDDWYMGTGAYTIDFFLRFDINVSYEKYGLFCQRVDDNNMVSCWMDYPIIVTKWFWLQYVDGGTIVSLGPFDASGKIFMHTWHHIAIIRGWGGDVNKHAIAIDGSSVLKSGGDDTTSDDWPQLAAQFEIGRRVTTASTKYSRAWFDEIRVSKGIARWTKNFSPPEMPHGSARNNWLIGSTRKLKGVKKYIKLANKRASTLTVKEWNGSIWNLLEITDNTSSGGVALAQTGTIIWPTTRYTSKVKLLENQLLYWYQFQLSVGDVSIYHVTLDTGWQDVCDIWDGLFRVVGRLKYQKGSDELDGTLHVNIETPAGIDAAGSYTIEIGGLLATDWIDVGLEDRTCALYVKMFEGEAGKVNTDASVLSMEYWDSEGWKTISGLFDGTADGGATFAKTGWIVWDYPGSSEEAQRNVYGAKLYYYRLKVSATLSTTVLIDLVRGVPAPNDPRPVYKFPFMFRSRPMLCGAIGYKEGNRVDFGITGSTEGFNGVESSFGSGALYFGSSEDLSCACELYNRFGANIYHMGVFCKDTETYLLTGYNVDNYTIRKISGSVGCPAPLTMDTVEMNYGMSEGVIRNVAGWLSYNGPYLFDAGVLEPITNEIACYFDKSDNRCINFSVIDRSRGWMDPDNLEYNLGLCSGAAQTEINVWLCFDLVLKRWYLKKPAGTDAYPQLAFRVVDENGAQYVYGFRDNGHMMQLENGANWDGSDMVQKIAFADQVPSKNIWDHTTIQHFKLFFKSISEAVNITGNHYKDGESTERALRAIAANGSNRYTRSVQKFDMKGFSHKFELEVITSSTVQGVPFLAWGYTYEKDREDL